MPLPRNGALGLSFLGARGLQFISLIVMMGLTAHFISDLVNGSQNPPPPIVAILSITCFAVLYIIISTILYYDQQLPFLVSTAIDFLFFLALMITTIIVGKPLSALSCSALGSDSSSSESLLADASPSLVTDTATAIPTPTPTTMQAATTTALQIQAETQGATVTAYTTVQNVITQTAAYVGATLAPGTTEATVKGSNGQTYKIEGQNERRDAASSAILKAVAYDNWVSVDSRTCTMMKGVWGFAIALTILFAFTCFACAFMWKQNRTPGPIKMKEAPPAEEA